MIIQGLNDRSINLLYTSLERELGAWRWPGRGGADHGGARPRARGAGGGRAGAGGGGRGGAGPGGRGGGRAPPGEGPAGSRRRAPEPSDTRPRLLDAAARL